MVSPESFFHVALKVPDVDAAVAFYRNHLEGDLLEHEQPAEDATGAENVEHAALTVGDKRVYVFDRAPYEAAGLVDELPYGFLHFGYVVPDVEAAAADLEDHVRLVMEPTVFGDLKVAFFEGPAGERLELLESLD
ncbi:VOC family protein [Natronolimnohabitans innermongolicus]|uniref:Lyase/ dioxygenase n=1 Tax=Natronolimnohabitans innermongolicus JCM 12255 TaxID=1227499 RepID=L9WLQ9_9EURY|nr:VOC family protein [Natronolimnohabitans innermongolicus]ELY49288.1 lyase/ dioxygenase [Natronolimnohabitans innermongolicus JCM 12255]